MATFCSAWTEAEHHEQLPRKTDILRGICTTLVAFMI
jgi:hypothetical protein